MIDIDAPSFIILVLAASMMAVLVSICVFLHKLQILHRPLKNKFTILHYALFNVFIYLIAQLLGLTKIIYHWYGPDIMIDQIIMGVFIVGNAGVIVAMGWVSIYGREEGPLPVVGTTPA